ncbi:MAG: RnfABCDGE type electron transport complex subunit D [Spirochaetales bacterium]|nr:RnfABCDGE type electron transport complex subunit D [Spirochaetales bacterium]
MKGSDNIFDKLSRIRGLKRFATIFSTLKGIVYGVQEISVGAPHIRDNIEIKRYMSCVIIALMPAALAAIYFHGLYVLAIIAVSYVVGGLVEVSFAVIRKKDIEEGFLVTGIIFPLTLPPATPLWIVAVGAFFGVLFGKEVFGGTGRNIFNPALVGRLFITIAFPGVMSGVYKMPLSDAITSATPLGLFKADHVITPVWDLLLGMSAGSLGEVFRLGIIAGGLFLMFIKVSNFRIPIAYLGTVALFAFIGGFFAPNVFAPPLLQLLTGGLLYGAFFMATDPVTSPMTNSGKWIAGILCGIFTVLIRTFSGYTEGVMFSIILVNALTPVLDTAILSIKYKAVKK